jgi:hypothetical protein
MDLKARVSEVERINTEISTIEKSKTKKEDLEGVRLDVDSDSQESIILIDDDKSEYKRSQTFRQASDLGEIPNEFKTKIEELKHIATNDLQDPNKHKQNSFSQLPSIGDNWYGFNISKLGLKLNYGVLMDSAILSSIGYAFSCVFNPIFGTVIAFVLYIVLDLEFFTDGFSVLDTTTPVKILKTIEKIPASANIIYEELINERNVEKYDIMLKTQPYIYDENSISHTKVKKLIFDLPEHMPYKILCDQRVWYIKEYHGVGENGICYITTKKLVSKTPKSLNLVEMASYEESIIIVPISGAESKVIFITEFDYGGKVRNSKFQPQFKIPMV